MSVATDPAIATGSAISSLAIPVVKRRRRAKPTFIMAIIMIAIVLLITLLVPFIPGYNPYEQDLSKAMLPPFQDMTHLLGTDPLGRDVLSRLAVAGQISLMITVAVVVINFIIGVTLGLAAGYFGGPVDNVIMGIADIQLAMPFILLLIAVAAVVGPSTALMIIMLGITFWVGYGRVARGIAMSLREREFVLAPLTQGASSLWIIRRHLLPGVVPQLAVIASFDIGLVVIVQAGLDFLGLGVQPPTPSWGGLISEGSKYMQLNPWLVILPGLMMFLFIAGVQFLSQRFTSEGGPSIARIGK
jgi:peptide/nickel transport system permease protein